MKAVILNSGIGSRMGALTKDRPKCLVNISERETILSRQLTQLSELNILDIVITIGPYGDMIPDYVKSKFSNLNIKYVRNDLYDSTNYIYSMFLAEDLLRDEIILMHGDIVIELKVLKELINSELTNVAIIDSTVSLPEKDFKAVIIDNMIQEIGINPSTKGNNCFLLPVYKFSKKFMNKWIDEIDRFIHQGNDKVYAENAFNSISQNLKLEGLDIKGSFCMEIDTENDLLTAKGLLR